MLEWMFWTYQTIIFLISVIAFFAGLIILDLKRRSSPRKGFLPFYTTRGDRVFLGTAFIIIIGILWLEFVPLPITYALIPGLVAFFIIVIWG